MPQSNFTRDTQIVQSTAAASTTTNFNFPLAAYTDQIIRARIGCYLSHATSGHLDYACSMVAEAVASNKNGTCALITAISGSTSPVNSSTTGNLSARSEVTDTVSGTPSVTLQVSGTTLQIQVNNAFGSVCNVTLVVDIETVGST